MNCMAQERIELKSLSVGATSLLVKRCLEEAEDYAPSYQDGVPAAVAALGSRLAVAEYHAASAARAASESMSARRLGVAGDSHHCTLGRGFWGSKTPELGAFGDQKP